MQTPSALPTYQFFLDAQVIRNAKLWCDVESVEEAKHLSKQWDWTLVPGFTASKILWLKNNEPENFSKLAKVLLPHDYFNYYLTGRYCMEASFWAQLVLAHLVCPSDCAAFNAKASFAPQSAHKLLLSCTTLSAQSISTVHCCKTHTKILHSSYKDARCSCHAMSSNSCPLDSKIAVLGVT